MAITSFLRLKMFVDKTYFNLMGDKSPFLLPTTL